MNFWGSALPGVIIGSSIAGAFTILAQVFAYQRQEKQFAHDLKVRQMQFAHEREQNNRDRRTAALDALQPLLDEQATALGDLWGFLMNPAVRPHVTISPGDAWKVLKAKDYRRRLWPMNLPLSKAINEYSGKMEDLFQFLNQQEVADVYAGKIPCLSEKTRTAMDPHFRAASTPLGVARKEVVNLMSELNDIQVQKST